MTYLIRAVCLTVVVSVVVGIVRALMDEWSDYRALSKMGGDWKEKEIGLVKKWETK